MPSSKIASIIHIRNHQAYDRSYECKKNEKKRLGY